MAIKVTRNSAGNCINFVGSSQPAYWNACLSAQVNADDNTRVDVINDIQTASLGESKYEFFAIPYTDFADRDGGAFSSAQEAAEYITANANVVGSTGQFEASSSDTFDFIVDQTNTTILVDNGDAFSVNSIKAIGTDDGLITIQEVNGANLYVGVYVSNVTIAGSSPATTQTAVVNSLNGLFTVTPVGVAAFDEIPTYPMYDGSPIVSEKRLGEIPTVNGLYTSTDITHAYIYSDENDTIDSVNEHFTFEMRKRGSIIIGLVDTSNSDDLSELTDDPTDFTNGGLQWGLHIDDFTTHFAPAITYGTDGGFVQGEGWSGSNDVKFEKNATLQSDIINGTAAVTYKIGILPTGFIGLYYLDTYRSNEFILLARSNYVVNGSYRLVVKMESGSDVALFQEPVKFLRDQTQQTLNYKFIESPDGQYTYPLFSSQDQANQVDLNNGGSGSSTGNVFTDEPTFTTWYQPNTGSYSQDTDATRIAALLNNPQYARIPTLADEGFVPAQFSGNDLSFAENTVVNIQIKPADATFDETVTGLPDGLTYVNGYIHGTTPIVSSSVVSTVTVTRDNAFGSSSGSFQLTVADNASIGTITGLAAVDGNYYQPNRIVLSEDALTQYSTQISQGEQLTYSYGNSYIPPSIGILSSVGEAAVAAYDSSTDELGVGTSSSNPGTNFAYRSMWDLRYVTFGGYVGGSDEKYILTGWSDNSTLVNNNGINFNVEFKLTYDTDGYIRLYRGGSLLKTSSSTFTGAKTITFAAFDDQAQSDVYVPTNLTITNQSYGTTQPPSGFENPLATGQMSTSTLMGEAPDEDAAVQLTQLLKVNHRLVFPQTWVESNVLPFISDEGNDFFVGVPTSGVSWTDVGTVDFSAVIKLDGGQSSSHNSRLVTLDGGTNLISVNSSTDAYYDYAFEWDGDDLHVIGCNIGDINTQPSVNNGGSFSRVSTEDAYTDRSGDLPVFLGVDNGGQVNLSSSGISSIRIPFGIRDILVGEWSNGVGHFAIQPTASDFDTGSYSGQHAPNWDEWSYSGVSTLNAGQTYRFIYHPSMEANDSIEFRLASDNTTVYTTGITAFDNTSDGNPKASEGYKGVSFSVPTDAPPLRLYYKNGSTADSGREISISGSTYVEPVTGVTLIGPAANQTGNNLFDAPVNNSVEWGWLSIDEQLSAGQRLVLDNAFLVDLTNAMPNNSMVQIGLKDGTFSTNNRSNTYSNFEGGARFEIYRYSASDTRILGYTPSGTISKFVGTNGVANYNVELALDLTSSGNNIRLMISSTSNSTDDVNNTAYADWSSSYKLQTGDQGFGLTSVDVVILGDGQTVGNLNSADGAFDTADVDWTGLSEISVPTAQATLTTSWTKALDFSGSSERAKQTSTATSVSPLKMGLLGTTTSAPTSGYTSNDTNSRPWAVSCVFNVDGNSSNQHIWNHGEGAGSTDDNIYLRVDANRKLYFGWGRSGNLNEIWLTTVTAGQWYGLYIAHTGYRVASSAANHNNLPNCFDIRFVNLSTGGVGTNQSDALGWANSFDSTTGGAMDKQVNGEFTIGGRGSNRNFHGKVASTVVTTLKRGVAMPTDTEISEMVRDPLQWLDDYKVGQTYRLPDQSGTTTNFNKSSGNSSYSTQVWLMGDGTSDGYATIRNQVYPSTQNTTTLDMVSMVSNDIHTVNISGLT